MQHSWCMPVKTSDEPYRSEDAIALVNGRSCFVHSILWAQIINLNISNRLHIAHVIRDTWHNANTLFARYELHYTSDLWLSTQRASATKANNDLTRFALKICVKNGLLLSCAGTCVYQVTRMLWLLTLTRQNVIQQTLKTMHCLLFRHCIAGCIVYSVCQSTNVLPIFIFGLDFTFYKPLLDRTSGQ